MTPSNNDHAYTITREEFDELKKRISEAEDRLHKGDITLALIDKHLAQIDEKLGEVSASLQVLRDKPAKRWESIVSQALTWAVALLLGYIALQLKLA